MLCCFAIYYYININIFIHGTYSKCIIKFSYISIFTNILRTDNETKSLKTIYIISIKKHKTGKEQTQRKYKTAIK